MTPAPAKIAPKPNTQKKSTSTHAQHADYYYIKGWHGFRKALAQKKSPPNALYRAVTANADGKKG